MKTIQTYANKEKRAVTIKTSRYMIRLISPSGRAQMLTAEIIRRLKAALPTIVEGPNSPAKKSP
eukprot:CAMPEP_0206617730 /NCGR_PEP_ID=MMETSP0325_2-20121206/59797_1 /ASSEMBLY_ACC=CAM_ASM_000347 /TAXON_ID=2866 /ORGANISM="Crypthecodinium cohnii, Strain Seligo" /LENGTH=63 /DNA_ID=CAMNT_0054139745 /DNA_START=39 /DNA_END=227 /DNA_ORIENTATION=-